MKKILKISGITALCILCVGAFVGLLIGSAILKNMSIHLAGQYSISGDRYLEKCYDNDSKIGIIYDEGLYIKDYTYDEDFILLDTWKKKEDCSCDESPWHISEKNADIEIMKCYEPALYIIDIKKDTVHGPMNVKEYVDMRKKIGVPDELYLKIKLEI